MEAFVVVLLAAAMLGVGVAALLALRRMTRMPSNRPDAHDHTPDRTADQEH